MEIKKFKILLMVLKTLIIDEKQSIIFISKNKKILIIYIT